MELSIVIPAYNEAEKISRDISSASEFLAGNKIAGEIIIVDDGSDNGTYEAAKEAVTKTTVTVRVLRLARHRGKGYAVRRGILESAGEYVMFADSGCCVPYDNALRGLGLIRSGECEIAHGSRKMVTSDIRRGQNWRRRIVSRVFRFTARLLLRVPHELTDTQCGFKVYKGDIARELYSKCVSEGFMFDVEVILRARRHGYRIKEFGVEWYCDLDSRLSPSRTGVPVFKELLRVRKVLGKDK